MSVHVACSCVETRPVALASPFGVALCTAGGETTTVTLAPGLLFFLREYFGVDGKPAVYSHAAFKRRSRVPRSLLLRIYNDIEDEPDFHQRVKPTGKLDAHPLQKLVAAFCVFCSGDSWDRNDEHARLSRPKISEAKLKLVEFVVREYRTVYLLSPTPADLDRTMNRNAQRGLPGCMGSLDFSHWEWPTCPKALASMTQG